MKINYKFDTSYLSIEDETIEKELCDKYDDYEFVYEVDDEEAKDDLIFVYLKVINDGEYNFRGSYKIREFLDYLEFTSNYEVFDWQKCLQDGYFALKAYYRPEAMEKFAKQIKEKENC